MAFRSLAVLSFLLVSASAAPAANAPPGNASSAALAAVNAALAARSLVLVDGVPVLK